MNNGLVVFLGSVLTFASAWLGLVVLPYFQLNDQLPYQASHSAEAYPKPPSDEEQAGRKVYQANGCIYCHTQQVRSQDFGHGADIARGWGQRRTVSRDYLFDRPILLGTMRTGPDLAAIGERNSSPEWHHEHLLNPRSKSAWSMMPAFSFLYEKQPLEDGQERDPNALTLGREWTVWPGKQYRPSQAKWAEALENQGEELVEKFEAANSGRKLDLTQPQHQDELLTFWLALPEDEFQVVPTEEANQLVAYLLGLRKTATPLPEANEP